MLAVIAVYMDFTIRNCLPHECSMAPAEADSSLVRIGWGGVHTYKATAIALLGGR